MNQLLEFDQATERINMIQELAAARDRHLRDMQEINHRILKLVGQPDKTGGPGKMPAEVNHDTGPNRAATKAAATRKKNLFTARPGNKQKAKTASKAKKSAVSGNSLPMWQMIMTVIGKSLPGKKSGEVFAAVLAKYEDKATNRESFYTALSLLAREGKIKRYKTANAAGFRYVAAAAEKATGKPGAGRLDHVLNGKAYA